MTIWFFGDSWPAGVELDRIPKTTQHSHRDGAFPALVGERLQVDIVNKAIAGSSQESMLESLLDCNIKKDDIAIFCCTAKTRRLYRRDDGTTHGIQFQHDTTYVNPYEDERVSSHCCALLYYLCMSRGCTPYFFNLFDCVRYVDRMYLEIPESHWLIPKEESVLSWLFDPVYFHKYDHHHNGNFRAWLDTESELVQRYIRPCEGHPNLNGHNLIAEYLVEQLQKRGHT